MGSECEAESESVIECTPMKALKSVPSLMDVTISPIVNKSILQSSNESVFSDSVIKETKSTDTTESGMKSLPAFTMNETQFDKSVLHSYQSSAEDTTNAEEKLEESVSKIDREDKSLPAFTISESYFEKSVLKSYQSSIAESSLEETKEKVITSKIELKPSSGSTTLNITDLNKSVLGNYQSSAESSQISKTKDFENSYKNVSSLMTSDSDIADMEMKEWAEKTDIQASVIQREKEKIVEIEREINEIEDGLSEDSDAGVESVSSDELGEDEENSDEEESEASEEVI